MRVAIVGGAPNLAHTLGDDFELWGLGRYAATLARVDRLFEVHEPAVFADWADAMLSRRVPIYMRHPILERSVDVDLDGIAREFGGYVTNSISIMLAWAIREGASVIEIHGAPMHDGGVYAHQKPSAMYYVGIAVGRGIEVRDRSGMVAWGALYG